MDVADCNIEVLAKRHITVAVDDKAAHDTLTPKSQPSVAPFVIKSHEVEILLRVVNTLGNLFHEI